MGTRHFTSVVLNGEQKVCQYGHNDGYPTYTGVKLLEFLRDVNLQKFKEALCNTCMILTPLDDALTYTGSTKSITATYNQIWGKMCQIHEHTGDWVDSFLLTMDMLKAKELKQQQVDDYLPGSRDTGCDILQYIYNRDLALPQLELCAITEEFKDVAEFISRECAKDVPGLDAQGYFAVDLDKGKVYMWFDGGCWQCNLDSIPQDIERTMALFEASSRYMNTPKSIEEYLSDIQKHFKALGISIDPTPEEIADLVAAGMNRFPNLKADARSGVYDASITSSVGKASLDEQIRAAGDRALQGNSASAEKENVPERA